MLPRCCAACPPSGSPRRATAHRSVRFVSIRVSAFCPPYDSVRAEHALASLKIELHQIRLDRGQRALERAAETIDGPKPRVGHLLARGGVGQPGADAHDKLV